MWRTIGLAALGLLTAVNANAHPLEFTRTTLALGTDGHFQVDLIVDLDALALGVPRDTDDTEVAGAIQRLSKAEQARLISRLARLFERRVRVRFDGRPAPFDVHFPDYGAGPNAAAERPTVIGLTARLRGLVPRDARDVVFFASRAFAPVHLTVVDETRAITRRTVLEPGARSLPFALKTAADRPTVPPEAARYLRLGFFHIVPGGLDHILFVLGLFLLSPRVGPLVGYATVFTVAHALTLALGALGILTLPPRVVEPLITLSIAWIAIENLAARQRHASWRAGIVFGFGLLHGLGFAHVLGELGLPPGQRTLALIAFNAGVELGQITVIAAALVTLGWFRRKVWYRQRVVLPLSLALAAGGLAWTVDRVVA